MEYLETKELIRFGPFDAAPCSEAAVSDLDFARWLASYVGRARPDSSRFPEDASPNELLEHLDLLHKGRLTNAAVLLFGKVPQQFLLTSEIRCAHFHGTEVAKPIPSYQVYKGTAFDLVDQAVDFVLSKIALSVGTRAESVRAPVTYEIPKEVVTEAIVNAVAHRDYTSNGSVAGDALRRPVGGLESRPTAAAADPREAARRPRVGAGKPLASKVLVP